MIRERMLSVQDSLHLAFFNSEHGSVRDCGGRSLADLLSCQASFTEKIAGSEHGDNGFLSDLVDHGKLHRSLLDIHDMSGRVALREDGRFSLIFHSLSGHAS